MVKQIDDDQMAVQQQLASYAEQGEPLPETEPVPAYQDAAIVPPLDVEQYLKETDLKTAEMRAKLATMLGFWPLSDALRRTDELLRETGWFRLRAQAMGL